MQFPEKYFEDEIRDGFYVSGIMKRSWAATLKLLEMIDIACRKHDIKYSISFGTMLGYVRHHQGFVPWDDDIDLVMLREDYEKFCSIFSKEFPEQCRLMTPATGQCNAVSLVVSRKGIYLDEDYLADWYEFPYPVGVDIEVFDVMPDDEDAVAMWKKVGDCLFSLIASVKERPENDSKLAKISEDPEEITYAEILSVQNCSAWAQETIDYIHNAEYMTGQKFKRKESVIRRAFFLFDAVARTYQPGEGTRRAIFSGCQRPERWFNMFPEELLKDIIRVPFEGLEVNMVRDYDTYLTKVYGDYHKIYRGALHQYPIFKRYEKQLMDETQIEEGRLVDKPQSIVEAEKKSHYEKTPHGGAWKADDYDNVFAYKFKEKDIAPRFEQNTPKKAIASLIDIGDRLLGLLDQAIKMADAAQTVEILNASQSNAIKIGETLEKTRGDGFGPVSELEQFCERVYELYSYLIGESETSQNDTDGSLLPVLINHIHEQYAKSKKRIDEEYLSRKEILFLPWQANKWKSMESLWKACNEDPTCDVHVMPISYQYKYFNEKLMGTPIYERNLYPDYVPTVAEEDYNIKLRHPDIIFINSPYDQYNQVMTVGYDKYSSSLYDLTNQLIYIPWFVMDEIKPTDGYMMQTTEYFIRVPGVVRSDMTIVQSEEMRETYINVLSELCGKETRSIWEKKIKGFGSPLNEATKGQEYKAIITSPIWDLIKKEL